MTVHCFPIDTPWSVGKVNCYLIDDDPLTLLDTGPNTGTAIQQLTTAFAGIGRDLSDIERIVVTHQHLDHCGLSPLLAQHSGAEVAAIEPLAPWLEDMSAALKLDDEFAADLMLRHGVPEVAVITLRSVAGNFRAFGAGPVPVGLRLTDGGTLGFAGRTLRVFHRPGHSPTCTIFHDEATGEVFGGDHLLGHVSSNPLVTRGRPHALVDYVASMQATAAMGVERVLPGHGRPVVRVAALVESRLSMHDRRARKIAKMLDAGPRSAHEIAQEMWGSTATVQAFLTLSEVLGHLDLLGDAVVADESGDVVRFAHA